MFFPLLTTGVNYRVPARFFQVGSQMIVGLLFLTLPLALPGCAILSSGSMFQTPDRPARAIVDTVPFFDQEKFQCGPAALAMALTWSGNPVQPADLTKEVFTTDLKGCLQSALIGATRRNGRVAYVINGSEALLDEVSAGNPVIVLVNIGLSWYPKWHYAVVIGFDRERDEIILHSGHIANEHLSSRVFLNIWHRSDFWGLLVLPPERLPAGAGELEWLEAVAGLETTDRWQGSAAGYGAALKRWPESFAAWMGLGNSRFNLHDLAGSAEAFRRAATLQPKSGIPLNNLAQVLSAQGRHDEAVAAAQQAVDRGGPFIDDFRQTLKEIGSR